MSDICMTHPDILKVERDGFLGEDDEVIYFCKVCVNEIYTGEECYADKDGVYCQDCAMDLLRKYEIVAGEEQ